jgi:hypothetical protein
MWKRRRLECRRAAEERTAQNRNRFIVAGPVIEREFSQAGSRVPGRLDFLPGCAMWRTYMPRRESRSMGGA